MEIGEVPSDLGIFGVLGDDAEGFEGFDRVLDFAFAAAGVFELRGDRGHGPFVALGSQKIPDGGELVFEGFWEFLLFGGDGNGFDRGFYAGDICLSLGFVGGLVVGSEPTNEAVSLFFRSIGVGSNELS